MDQLSLPEELALVHRNRSGGAHGLPGPAVTAGALAELGLLGSIQLDHRKIHVVDPRPTAVPMFDDVLGRLVNRGKPTRLSWFLGSQAQLHESCLGHLTRLGYLRAEQRKVLGLFPIRRYWPDETARDEVLARVWHLLRGWPDPDGRTRLLASLLHGSGAGEALFRERADRKALKEINRQDVLGTALLKLRNSQGAAAGGMIAAGGAAGAGGGS